MSKGLEHFREAERLVLEWANGTLDLRAAFQALLDERAIAWQRGYQAGADDEYWDYADPHDNPYGDDL